MSDSQKKEEPQEDRRKFIITSTIAASTACALFPLASGIPSVLDPNHNITHKPLCACQKTATIKDNACFVSW